MLEEKDLQAIAEMMKGMEPASTRSWRSRSRKSWTKALDV